VTHCRQLLAASPVAGPPSLMSHRNDTKVVFCNLIEDAIRKPAKNVAASGSTKDGANLSIGQDCICRSLKFDQERATKISGRACGVELCSIAQLGEREGNDDESHLRAARTCAKASEIGMT